MKQLTLRKIPRSVEKHLRAHSKRSGLSLNKTAISLLSNAMGIKKSPVPKRKRDLSRFLGSMSDYDASLFNENTQYFRTTDRELWK